MQLSGYREQPNTVPASKKGEIEKMIRVGMGYDVHKLTEGRDLILGGVKIPWEKGLLGHSDADVVVHAIMDALLGAAALRDIGRHFPDTDPSIKGSPASPFCSMWESFWRSIFMW